MALTTQCPKCGAAIAPAETFCGGCGYQVQASETDRRDIGARVGLKHEKQTHQQRIRSGRTTILVVAILFILGGAYYYFDGRNEIQKAEKEIDAARGNERFDQDRVAEADREIKKASAQNTVQLAVNVLLVLCYFGLWMWAKTSPMPATLAALILFVTLMAVNAVIEPKTLVRGIIVKVLIIAFLVKAVDSARKYQRMREHGV